MVNPTAGGTQNCRDEQEKVHLNDLSDLRQCSARQTAANRGHHLQTRAVREDLTQDHLDSSLC